MAQKEKMRMKKLAKRVLWTLTALCMLFASATAVYGDDIKDTIESVDVSKEIDVRAYRTESAETEVTIYSVDITWSTMLFEYQAGYKGQWDPGSLSYKGTKEANWVVVDENGNELENGNRIHVYNFSEVPVRVGFSLNDVVSSEITYEFVNDREDDSKPALEKDENNKYYVEMDISKKVEGQESPQYAEIPVALEITGGELPKATEGFTKEVPGKLGTITISIEPVPTT